MTLSIFLYVKMCHTKTDKQQASGDVPCAQTIKCMLTRRLAADADADAKHVFTQDCSYELTKACA